MVVGLSSIPPSPAAAEAARLARAEQAMKQFCIDLSGLVGRTLDPTELDLENLDPITAEIYSAAVEAGIDITAVMSAEPEDVASTLEGRAPWLGYCSRVLAKLRRNVPESSYHRLLEVLTGSQTDAMADPDAQVCLEYATYFFKDHDYDTDALADLGACLLDYAFTRQGLDDELARVTRRKPAELQKALERTGGGKEPQAPVTSKVGGFDEHLESITYELFVVAVKKTLRQWKPALVADIIKMHPDTVYRVAMTANGYPTGDGLVQTVFRGALRHRGVHASELVTIGHAALSLEVLMARRGLSPTDHGITIVKGFCRHCASGLVQAPHGCCITDRMTQATELQEFAKAELRNRQAVKELRDLRNLWDTQPDTRAWFHQNPHRQPLSSRRSNVRGGASYELRTTPLLDGSPDKLEVHLDIWDDGIWQEVPSVEAADRFALRALQEAERAQALTRPQRQGDATHLDGDYRVVTTVRDSPINKHSLAKIGRIRGGPTLEQLIVCKYPTCSKFAAGSHGRYCEHHAREMGHVDEWLKLGEELEDKLLEEMKPLKELPAPTTALAKVGTAEELELRQLNSQTNFGKSLRWLAIVLGGVALGLTKSLMVLPLVAVAWVMAYAFIDHKAIAAQKTRLALKSGESSK